MRTSQHNHDVNIRHCNIIGEVYLVMSGLMDHVKFSGHSAEEVAQLCNDLARAADLGALSYMETAIIARKARDCIEFMLKRIL